MFHRGQIGGDAVFRRIVFKKQATFSRMRIRGDLFLRDPPIEFEDDALFRVTEVDGEADFLAAVFHKKWDLRWARFSTLKLDEGDDESPPQSSIDHFSRPSSCVDMRACSYSRIEAHWRPLLRRQDPFDRQPYAEFERALRTMAKDEVADDVYYQRRRIEGRRLIPQKSELLSRRLWNGLLRASGNFFTRLVSGYGVRPWRMLLFVLLFPILAWSAFYYSPGAVRPKMRDNAVCSYEGRPSWQDAGWLSVELYLPIDIPSLSGWEPSPCTISDIRIPRTTISIPIRLRASSIGNLLKVAGWIFIPIAAVTFTGLLRYVRSGHD